MVHSSSTDILWQWLFLSELVLTSSGKYTDSGLQYRPLGSVTDLKVVELTAIDRGWNPEQ